MSKAKNSFLSQSWQCDKAYKINDYLTLFDIISWEMMSVLPIFQRICRDFYKGFSPFSNEING
jgi:hypothetical protein